MTAGKAIELCDQMRPNNDFADEMKQMWLRQCDARLRQTVVNRSACGDFDAVGADMAGDGLEYDTELFKSKYITSLFALQIVQFIEKEFHIKLGRKDITEANFHTINAMAELVHQRLSSGR